MSIYRETAKWLLGLVPVTSVATLGVALAPRLDEMREVGFGEWFRDHPSVVIATGATVLAVLVLVAACCHVLLAAPTLYSKLGADANWLSEAFSDHGVGQPEFADSGSYESEVSLVTSREAGARADAVDRARAKILDLSAEQNARARFKRFAWIYAIAVITIVGGVSTVIVELPEAKHEFETPTPVQVLVADSDLLKMELGCDPSTATFVAVGGSWEDPLLRVFGPGCAIDDHWEPPSTLKALVAPK